LVVDNAAALTLEFQELLDLLESVSLSLFHRCDNLRRSCGSGSEEHRRSVRLGLRDQEWLLNGADELVAGHGDGRRRDHHLRCVSNLLLSHLFALFGLLLDSLVKGSDLLFVIHVLSGFLNVFKVGKLLKREAEAFESTEVGTDQNSEEYETKYGPTISVVSILSSMTALASMPAPLTVVTFASSVSMVVSSVFTEVSTGLFLKLLSLSKVELFFKELIVGSLSSRSGFLHLVGVRDELSGTL